MCSYVLNRTRSSLLVDRIFCPDRAWSAAAERSQAAAERSQAAAAERIRSPEDLAAADDLAEADDLADSAKLAGARTQTSLRSVAAQIPP